MSIDFYFDEHVHGALTEGLRRHIGVLTVQKDLRDGAPDETIFARAIELGRVLVSSHADMLVLAAQFIGDGTDFPGLLYMNRGALISHLESMEYIAMLPLLMNCETKSGTRRSEVLGGFNRTHPPGTYAPDTSAAPADC